jgi:hypothetical protein
MGTAKKTNMILEYRTTQDKKNYFRFCFDVLQMEHSGNLGDELEVGLRLLSS